ncbi:PilZ domain-containing protein [Paenibacillus agricola]|uniref:PilZ domain-containing protein n=1 Tax=Paenibacillus agricola TaxID=2716264 RepID=A0ABX0JIW6_9BACL|nr:PilZ domain-containing protein [Paenibacillus agricola]NHN35425.1 PilZ domain-containing protein [Paenibacillus agricola]
MDRREHKRIDIDPMEMVFEEIEGSCGTYKQVSIFIEEVSLQGIRFTTNVEFLTDELIHFHLPSMDVRSLLTGRISWKMEKDTHYQYGLKFLTQ